LEDELKGGATQNGFLGFEGPFIASGRGASSEFATVKMDGGREPPSQKKNKNPRV